MPIDRRSPAIAGLATASLLSLAVALGSAAEDPLSAFGEVVDVDLVNLEVVVTDREGLPVTGLAAADFTVFEDREEVRVTHFYAVDRRSGTEALEGLPAEATRRLSLVLLTDRAGLAINHRQALLDAVGRSVERAIELDGQVLLATVDGGVTVQHPFTRDPAAIRETLERLAKEVAPTALDADRRLVVRNIQSVRLPPFDPMDPYPFESAVHEAERLTVDLQNLSAQETRRVKVTAEAISTFLDSMAGLPGRKAVILLTDGFADRISEGYAELWRAKFQRWLDENRLGVGPNVDAQLLRNLNDLEFGSRYDTSHELTALAKRAAEHRVIFYPVSVGGNDGGLSAESSFSSRQASITDAFARETSMLDLAATTGGHAWLKGLHLERTLDQVASDAAVYYSLGYEPRSPGDGRFHEVRVEVRGKDLEVRAARGYREKTTSERLREQTLAALLYGGGANALSVRLAEGARRPSPQGGKRSIVEVRIEVPYRSLLLVPDADSHIARLTLVVAVRDTATGGVSEPQEITLPVRIPNDRLGEALNGIAVYPLELDLDAGSKLIAVAIRDQLARVDALARLELTVGG